MTVTIFGDSDWYLECPEPEQEWQGQLRGHTPVVGPATRSALKFILIAGGKSLPVYAPNVDQKLASYVGIPLIVLGKLVDLTDEGFGPEIWIGSIQPVDPGPNSSQERSS